MAENQDISMFRGEDKILEITLTPVTNITTWTLAFTVRETPESAVALIEKTVGAGITITGGAAGVFQVALADTDTASALQPGRYAYDCKRTTAGLETILVYGVLTLLAEVTR